MLREDGYVFDDGTTSRLSEEHFFMTTTTSNAARVLAHMEQMQQTVWPDLDVHFCSATEQWCGVAVAGPNARAILQEAFGKAHLMCQTMHCPLWEYVSLTGTALVRGSSEFRFPASLAYEVNVPWRYGETMWSRLTEAGKSHGMIPYGTEALNVMRIEKGHVTGNELDGRTTAADIGLGAMMSSKKEFVGKRMAGREGMADPERPCMVGVNSLLMAVGCAAVLI